MAQVTYQVVTGSTADLPADLAEQRWIEVVPPTVRAGDRVFPDGTAALVLHSGRREG